MGWSGGGVVYNTMHETAASHDGALWSCPRRCSCLADPLPSTWLVRPYVIDHESICRESHLERLAARHSLINCLQYGDSSAFAASLRRSALSARVVPRTQCLRLAPQVRRISSATSEPHQPDSKGGLDGPAPAKTIKFTSESYVAIFGDKNWKQRV